MEKLKTEEINQTAGNTIKLNVGGQYFTTSKTTLLADKNSMLGTMFSGYHELTKSSDGSYFIDADGTYFQTILNFLRGRITDVNELPKDEEVLLKLRAEADFYQLSTLKELITASLAKGPRMNQKWVNSFFPKHNGYCFQNANELNLQCLNLDGLAFSNIYFNHNVSFRNSSLVGASFRGSSFEAFVDFTSADIKNCDFHEAQFSSSSFKYIETAKNLEEAKFDDEVAAVLQGHYREESVNPESS